MAFAIVLAHPALAGVSQQLLRFALADVQLSRASINKW
jgi:hypothetical protein